MRLRVKWEVQDGYAGKSRPQYTYFTIDKVAWVTMSQDERFECAIDEVHEHFEEVIYPAFGPGDIEVIDDE
jgi:hypothetical protein